MLETWATARERLVELGATEAQLEAVRRAGAHRRHAARISAAQEELVSLVDACLLSHHPIDRQAVGTVVRDGIEQALRCIGTPGSASGSAPPGWYRDSPSVGARVAALEHALQNTPLSDEYPDRMLCSTARLRPIDYLDHGVGTWHGDTARPAVRITARHQNVIIYRDDEDCTEIGQIASSVYPVLAEHVLAIYVETDAVACDLWLQRLAAASAAGVNAPGGLDWPGLPDADAAEELERLINARRYPPPPSPSEPTP